MKVYFLGTGTSQGIPVIGSQHSVCLSSDSRDKRLRVSVWIEVNETSIVIDCGPDFRQQMLTSKCQHIDGLLFTHEHSDHTAGLDDIRPFYFKQGDIKIFAHKRVLVNLEKRFDYIFETELRKIKVDVKIAYSILWMFIGGLIVRRKQWLDKMTG